MMSRMGNTSHGSSPPAGVTWDPTNSSQSPHMVLSNGNLTVTHESSDGDWGMFSTATIPLGAKQYYEFTLTTGSGSFPEWFFSSALHSQNLQGEPPQVYSYVTEATTIGLAIYRNASTGAVTTWFRNASGWDSGDPNTLTGGNVAPHSTSDTLYMYMDIFAKNNVATMNPGPTFTYTPPSGFAAP